MISDFVNDKNYKPMENAGIVFFAPVVSMGLFSGLSPYSLANLIVFLIFLCLFCSNRKQVFASGIFFATAALITKFFLLNDFFYLIFNNPRVINVYKIIYIILSVLFILIGFFNFSDWMKLRMKSKDRKLFIRYPSFLKNIDVPSGEKKLYCYNGFIKEGNFVFLLLLAVFLGIFLTVLESLWPQDHVFLSENIVFVSQDKILTVKLRVFIYSLLFTAPFWFLWAGALKVIDSKGSLVWISRNASTVKIIFSALFIAIGASLIYIF